MLAPSEIFWNFCAASVFSERVAAAHRLIDGGVVGIRRQHGKDVVDGARLVGGASMDCTDSC
jgi:hypothetical protein